MQARLQSDPQGAQIEINAMIANRVAQLTIELSSIRGKWVKNKIHCNVKTKRIRFKSYGYAA